MLVFQETEDIREAQDQGRAIWIADLSDGRSVYEHERAGSTWLALGSFVRESGIRIVDLRLKFRSITKMNLVPRDTQGYFFCKSAAGMFGTPDTFNFYLVGSLHNDILRVQRWSVPELILIETQERDPGKAGQCLIRNQSESSTL